MSSVFYSSLFITGVILGLGIALVFIPLWSNEAHFFSDSSTELSPLPQSSHSLEDHVSSKGSATSGRLFEGARVRVFDQTQLQHSDQQKERIHIVDHLFGLDDHIGDLHCNHWSVVTTIFEPSEAVRRQAGVENWCLVIVGDKKGPKEYPIDESLRAHNRNHTNNVIYLTVDDQLNLESHLPLLSKLPWNHFGRKNVGYLYAILHGASVIWDFDDDNALLRADGKFQVPGMDSMSIPRVRRLQEYKATADDILSVQGEMESIMRKRRLGGLSFSSSTSQMHIKIMNDEQQLYEYLLKLRALKAIRRDLANTKYIEDNQEFSPKCHAKELGKGGNGWPRKYTSFNPYMIMGAPYTPSWPRGLPLELIKKNDYDLKNLVDIDIPLHNVGVIQSLANNDPDVDAIYRLTQPIPFSFPRNTADSNGNIRPLLSADGVEFSGKPIQPLLVPKHTYAPYNAQATLHLYPALWSLLLPVTIHGRVSDIWRGYLAQKLFRDIGLELLFSPPLVRQDRNVHNYIGDLESEGPLYARSHVFVKQLQELVLQTNVNNFPGRMEELWVWAYERDYLQIQDVHLCQSWIESLQVIGYKFPISGTSL